MLCFSINNKIFFIQGRVIKKAKRRNLNEDQKQNIFNSFGGFSSTNSVTASEAFSFLSTPASNGSSAAPESGSASKDQPKSEENKEGSQPPPAQEEKVNGTAPVDDFFAKFMKKSSGWSCDICMISNGADVTKCVACESPKPGYQPPEPSKEATQQVGANGFKFGLTGSQTVESSSATSGFKFGSDSKTAASEAPGGGAGQFGGFKFGSSTETESKPSGGFLFGASVETKATGGFLFGSSTVADQKVTGGFQFGSSSDVDKEDSVSDTSACKGFRFTDKIGSKLDSDASDTPKTKSKKGEYLSNLKSLNTQVTSWIKTHVDKNPLVDLTPVFKDYEKHIGKLRTKYNITAPVPAEQVKDATKVLSFGSSPSPFSAAFGSNQVPKPVGFGQTSGFQFGLAGSGESKPENKESIEKEDEEEEEEEESSKKPADPVVEEDSIFSQKCKLFYKKADSYVERGKGNLHLKLTEEQKVQLVIRAETSLGNILLNTLVTATTPLERIGKNNVVLVTLPNPPIDPKAESEPVTFLVRVKTTEDADELKQKLNDLCKN